MRDVKPKQDEYMGAIAPGKLEKKKSDPVYPRVRLDFDTLPEAKKWEVGKQYEVTMKLKMVGLSISKYDNSADFEIRQIGGKDVKPESAEEESVEGEDDGD